MSDLQRLADLAFFSLVMVGQFSLTRAFGSFYGKINADMFKNHFKIAWRNLLGNRTSSFINIGGLSIGMAVAMLIGCWMYNEWSFDRQFGNYKKIAQVWALWPARNGAQQQLPAPVAEMIKLKNGSDFKYVVHSSQNHESILSVANKKLIRAGRFMEPDALKMFDLPMLRGGRSALDDPHSIILSASLASAFFGDEDPVARIIKMDDSVSVKVTGVYKDFPDNSTFSGITFLSPWSLFTSIDAETRYNGQSWGDNNWLVYTQLADNAGMTKVSAKIKDIKATNDPWLDSAGKNRNTSELFLHPMSRWHLYSAFDQGAPDSGRIRYVRLFGMIGAFVLLLACINFMNLSTARSEKRAKEVGIRKTIGSLRRQLIAQFYTESLLVSVLSLLIALGLLQLALPFFNGLAESKMTIPWSNPLWWTACAGFALFTGLIAGSYPALYLSSFEPIRVLKGVWRMGRLAALPRRVLVVLQFTVSIAMIIGTIIVFRQVQYAKDRPVGYSRQGLVMVQTHTLDIFHHFSALRSDLLQTGAISEVTQSFSPITASWPQNGGLTWTGHLRPGLSDNAFTMKVVTPEYARTVGLQFTEGRDFRPGSSGADSKSVILNQATVKEMGLKNPVGSTITWMKTDYTVIGVVKDVVMESPYESTVSAIYNLAPWQLQYVTMRINPDLNPHTALQKINSVFARYSPDDPFDYKFIDQEYDAKFRGEVRIGQLAGFFTILAILISCLGLFGLASFIAEQRTREIGVRKVLGASIFTLWRLLSTDFLALICFSCLIAIPLAYWLLHQWLQQFVYRTPVSWWIFAAAATGSLFITVITVSFQAIKAASANPVKSLRSE